MGSLSESLSYKKPHFQKAIQKFPVWPYHLLFIFVNLLFFDLGCLHSGNFSYMPGQDDMLESSYT